MSNDKPTLRYLARRCFSDAAIDYFRLGVVDEGNTKWLWYPYFESGKLVNVKKRTLPPADKGFKRLFGGKSVMYNIDALACAEDHIIIVEGEADCVSVWSSGITNVCSIPDGAGSLPPNVVDRLDRFARIYLCYDGDAAGQNGATKAAKRLGMDRCFNVRLPTGVKDSNEYLLQHSGEDYRQLIRQAEKFDIEDVKSVSGVIQDMIVKLYVEGKKEEGLPYPWASVQKLAGAMKSGDMILVAGRPKVGKTTLALQIMFNLTMMGVPSLVFELEMAPYRLIPRIISMDTGIPTEDVETMEVLSTSFNKLKDIPFYFAYKWKKPEWQVVEDTTKLCIRRYGIRFMVFDNLHFLCRKEDRVEEVSAMSQNFKMLAEECGIPILIIARPKKVARRTVIDSDDLMWTADLHADADTILIIHRERRTDVEKDIKSSEGIYVPETLIRIDASRYSRGGDTYLTAHDETGLFTE